MDEEAIARAPTRQAIEYATSLGEGSAWKVPFLYTRRHMRFANAVARRLQELRGGSAPDLMVSTFAYTETFVVPPDGIEEGGGGLHPAVLPFIAAPLDEAEYDAPPTDLRVGPLRTNVERWAQVARTLGLYDYMFGDGFIIPRIYVTRLANALRHGYRHRARAFFGEVSPNWGLDAFQVYTATRLLWNIDTDVDRERADFVDALFGTSSVARYAFYKVFQYAEAIGRRHPGRHHLGAISRDPIPPPPYGAYSLERIGDATTGAFIAMGGVPFRYENMLQLSPFINFESNSFAETIDIDSLLCQALAAAALPLDRVCVEPGSDAGVSRSAHPTPIDPVLARRVQYFVESYMIFTRAARAFAAAKARDELRPEVLKTACHDPSAWDGSRCDLFATARDEYGTRLRSAVLAACPECPNLASCPATACAHNGESRAWLPHYLRKEVSWPNGNRIPYPSFLEGLDSEQPRDERGEEILCGVGQPPSVFLRAYCGRGERHGASARMPNLVRERWFLSPEY